MVAGVVHSPSALSLNQQPVPQQPYAGDSALYVHRVADDRVTLRSRCTELRARLVRGKVEPAPQPSPSVSGPGSTRYHRGNADWVVHAKRPIWWPDGRHAGALKSTIRISKDPYPHSSRFCMPVNLSSSSRLARPDGAIAGLAPEADRQLRMCVDRSDIQEDDSDYLLHESY